MYVSNISSQSQELRLQIDLWLKLRDFKCLTKGPVAETFMYSSTDIYVLSNTPILDWLGSMCDKLWFTDYKKSVMGDVILKHSRGTFGSTSMI